MSIHRFQRTQHIHCTLSEAWDFFSNPQNLKLITPSEMGFDIVGNISDHMYAGMLIQYRVKPLLNIPTTWLTEITQVQEPFFFIDEQRVGPYRLWHHQHHFKEEKNGVSMTDTIHYIIPFAPLGELIHPVIKKKLEHIFSYRSQQIDRLFQKL